MNDEKNAPYGVTFSNSFDESEILAAVEYALDFDTTPLAINEVAHQLEVDLVKAQILDYLRSDMNR